MVYLLNNKFVYSDFSIFLLSFLLADKALTAVFDDLFKSSLYSKIVEIYRKILIHPEPIAPLRDLVSNALFNSFFMLK